MKFYGFKGKGKPVVQPLAPGAPDPGQPQTYRGTGGLPGAPDPFGQYQPRLQGNAPYGLSLAQELPGAQDPVAGNYSPQLSGAPDPYTGYQGALPGAPQFAVFSPPEQLELPGAPQFAVFSPPEQLEPPEEYEPPEHEDHDIPEGPTLHNPGWFT